MNIKNKAEELIILFESKEKAILCVEQIIDALDWHKYDTPNVEISEWLKVKQLIIN